MSTNKLHLLNQQEWRSFPRWERPIPSVGAPPSQRGSHSLPAWEQAQTRLFWGYEKGLAGCDRQTFYNIIRCSLEVHTNVDVEVSCVCAQVGRVVFGNVQHAKLVA